MQIAPLPADEQNRLRALKEYQILDTMPEAEFEDIVQMASEICGTPISLVSLVDADRQWFKSKVGIDVSESGRDTSFCSHAIVSNDAVFVVPDATKDARFNDNPLVTGAPHIVFYAGVPLINPQGYALGTLCVSDTQPRQLSERQLKTLQSLARLVVSQMEQRKTIAALRQHQDELKNAYADLDNFATIASHDLKSPLNNIITIAHLLEDAYATKLDTDGNQYVRFLKETSYKLSALIVGILKYSRSSNITADQRENIVVSELITEVLSLLKIPDNALIHFENSPLTVYSSRVALKQIILNLLDNALKYNDKEYCTIKITTRLHNNGDFYLEVADNGVGIKEADQKFIFDLFKKLKNRSPDSDSTSVGLAIVKRLTDKLRGTVSVTSEPGAGSVFCVTLPE